MEQDKKLFIGLDVGTNSVGWAATDQDFNLYRLKGKTAWGARIFEEASPAKARRAYRAAGRRLARRKERIRLLNTLFDDLLKEKDPTFLVRLENSTLHGDDPNKPEEAKGETLLFKNRKEEKEYYKAYPTIWHLRQALINNEDHAFSDIRYLYLAIHHIIKYRGNFVKEGEKINIGKFDDDCFASLNKWFLDFQSNDDDEENIGQEVLPTCNYREFVTILLDKGIDKKHKASALLKLMQPEDDSQKNFAKAFCLLVCGCKASLPSLDEGEYDEDSGEAIVFDKKYDENVDKIKAAVGDDMFELVEIAKIVSDFRELNDLIGDSKNLSSAFVSIYEEHKKDLSSLKSICKEIDYRKRLVGQDSVYVQLFADKKSSTNYFAFVNKRKDCSIESLNSFVVKLIEPFEPILSSSALANWLILKEKAKSKSLLKIIALCSTSVIPMQLHQQELKCILDNAVARQLQGIESIKENILAIFKFRIPYYCGPISDKSPYSNVVFKTAKNGGINPLNFEDSIDFEKTKQKFMEGLTNKCTYLKDKNVLPKQSLLYQDFDAWNKLNNIVVNGHKMTMDEMKSVYFFASHRKKTTLNDVKKYLKTLTQSKENDLTVSGLNPNDFIDLSSRAALSNFFDLSNRFTKDYENCEKAILLKTYFTDSAADAKRAVKEHLDLNDSQMKALERITCKGWCGLSKEFLLLKDVDNDGVVSETTIMDHLEAGEGNLMQIYHDERYNYRFLVESHNNKLFEGVSADEIIDKMPPSARRSTIQAVRIVQEITKVAKKTPDVISIEVTRETNDEKAKDAYRKKAINRKEQLHDFLVNLTKDDIEGSHASLLLKELDGISDEDALRGKHLFLYFLQGGRDLYTGDAIDINDVFDASKYDIDHIIPQSLIKDDSIDNMVLVKREINQKVKKGFYPIPESIRQNPNVIALWRRLKKQGMISDKKYNNLIRATKLTEQELDAFVEAQINVVNRSNKVIRDVLQMLYPNAKLIFSKAQYPSQIRHKLAIPKLRDLNDTHHAFDAYLNVVAGVKLQNQFGQIGVVKAALDDNTKASLNMEAFINRAIIKNETGDERELTELGEKINAYSLRHDFLLTYRFAYKDDAFYDATIYGHHENADVLVPIHNGWDVSKYGGYSNFSRETNCVALIKGSKEPTRYLLGIPHMLMLDIQRGIDVSERLSKLVPHKRSESVEIQLDNRIPLYATVKKDGVKYLLMGMNAKNAKLYPFSPIFLTRESEIYMNNLLKVVEKYPNDAKSENSLIIERSRIHLGGEKTKIVAKELFSISAHECYKYCPMIKELAQPEFQAKCLEEISKSTLEKQKDILLGLVSRFTRKSVKFSNKYFSKSRGAILQDKLTLCSTSITGLFETERKL